MLKKLISSLLVMSALIGVAGCHAHAGVGTKHHGVAIGTKAK
jgi:hypothetical protein